MNTSRVLLVCFLLYCLVAQQVYAAGGGKIKHVIVLMEENRSFDQIFGFRAGVNGLTGKEYNLVDDTKPTSERIVVNSKQPQVALCDPDHSTSGTTVKIFGTAAAAAGNYTVPTMAGFIAREGKDGHANNQYCAVLESFSPDQVPVISALADNFVLMERFFCDHPGPTWPNRLFALTATAAGCTSTGTYYHNKDGSLYPQKTFFEQIDNAGLTWKQYYNDTPWEVFIKYISDHPQNLVGMSQFYKDAREGTLPNFAWINPRLSVNKTTGEASNDQHPDHDVSLGEKYYKDIYEALRISPQWNETLFIVTYDEHGGFYDHVPTPLNVPPPGDGEASYPDKNFMFDRIGVRIPTLLISPLLPKGLVLNAPPAAQKPTNNSEYVLTSIMATTRKLLGMPSTPLTKRDAWAATFEHIFTLNTPRTDCPLVLPSAAKASEGFSVEAEAEAPVNGLQEDVMYFYSGLVGVEYPSHIKKQGEVGEWLQTQFQKHVENVRNRK